jgi:hypothetical protein
MWILPDSGTRSSRMFDPIQPARRRRERLSFLDDVADEEMLRDDQQVDDRERLEVVVHQ